MQIKNTAPQLYWLTSYLETALLRAIWYPTTVATVSWEVKQTLRAYLQKTSDDAELQLPFKLHDFGGRKCIFARKRGIRVWRTWLIF